MKPINIILPAALLCAAAAHGADTWTLLGTGQLQDAWVTPGLDYPHGELNPADYPFEVQIYESVERPGVYRLGSPWTSDKFPFVHRNANTTPHDIIIDASDPDFVLMEPQESGFVAGYDGHSPQLSDPFYICNRASNYYYNEGKSKAEIQAAESRNYQPGDWVAKLSDGVITIPHVFGPSATDNGYVWSSMPLAKSVVTLPGGNIEHWVDGGEVTFTDGFIAPRYVGDPKGYSWTVPFEKMEGREGMYRLVNPYQTADCPLAEFNLSTEPAWIVIDATDPDMVIVKPQFSGFADNIAGERVSVYVGNDVGSSIAIDLVNPEDLKNSSYVKKDRMKDGVITIAEPLIGKNGTTDFGYRWDGTPVYAAVIRFPWAPEEPEEPEVPEERERTFYEGFEAWSQSLGLNWIPDGWTEINTEANKPTDFQLLHNINNTWFVYESSDFYQGMTPDGKNEAYIHFSYDHDNGWCTAAEQDEWLVTPSIRLRDDERLSFLLQADLHTVYEYTNGYFDYSTLTFSERIVTNTLKVMITADGGQSWDELWDLERDVTSKLSDLECWNEGGLFSYKPYSVELDDYAGKDVKIAFRYMRKEGDFRGDSMLLDGIVVDHPVNAGITDPDTDIDVPAEYYNLQGLRVADINAATPGIYIERRGTESRKILKR